MFGEELKTRSQLRYVTAFAFEKGTQPTHMSCSGSRLFSVSGPECYPG
jgi:hypothetical protein